MFRWYFDTCVKSGNHPVTVRDTHLICDNSNYYFLPVANALIAQQMMARISPMALILTNVVQSLASPFHGEEETARCCASLT